MSTVKVSKDMLEEFAGEIISTVDYDIYKDDLEEGVINSDVQGLLISFLNDLGLVAVFREGGDV